MQVDLTRVKRIFWWLFSVVLLVDGLVFCYFISGCSFLGIVCCCLALLPAGFNLLFLLEKRCGNWARRGRKAMSIALCVLLAAIIVTLVPILRGPGTAAVKSDYVIVLGAGVKGNEPSEILRDRIEQAYLYLSNHPDAICIASGGKGDGENISEAQCIYDHLTARGIDGSRIWLEDKATSTIENFRYSLALIEDKTGAMPKTVTVLSNEFHLYRASRMAHDCGLQADFVAAPTSNFLIRVSYTIREVFALWKYLIVGG